MKVLVVEDDLRTADALRRGLEAAGYGVEVAHDGEDGLWFATETAVDAIVLDIMLPKLNGYLLCRALREREVWTPILMLTAKDGEWDEAEGLDTGADDYLVKPFSFPVLLARLRALLRRSSSSALAPVEVGDLRIDAASRRVWRADTPIELTARQFDVLEFLVRRAEQVQSKGDILDGVWSHDYDGDPNIVEVYVKRLRRAIDEPFGRRSIETVRGAGYRIVDDQEPR
ncbi:MAG: response regulator transcription factor [Ilumatobacter sp.]|nr:response regulator transcription factor [Ilumatobacter sp.]